MNSFKGMYDMKNWLIILCILPCLSAATENSVDCNDPYTTPDINYCAGKELEGAEATMKQYFKASLKRQEEDIEVVDAIKLSQHDWLQYRESYCDAIYSQWREGTIRGVMYLSCKKQLTQQRTHTLWADFLTYMDSTEPVLPEPIFN
ncbi:lysozyme inhibitor LprI family protein [Marinomonas ostreistagni]|uniref:DUF1311 domain-containing protein n=1 Tax=Marinomonas ostreistagni TaxID=359209 RepID=A0ABS0Z981_9GAMM|nr:lysozyme inhibitor LprI family protein [Marinomonas ostreistagni]MBJ7550217.1 DUF1311 domain-containing protein [Marinomonas ostreistagni]